MVSGRVVIGSLLAVAGLSLACGDSGSPLTPTSPTPRPPALTVRSVSPSSGPISGGDQILIMGTGFQSATTLMIDGIEVDSAYSPSGCMRERRHTRSAPWTSS